MSAAIFRVNEVGILKGTFFWILFKSHVSQCCQKLWFLRFEKTQPSHMHPAGSFGVASFAGFDATQNEVFWI